MAVEVDGKADYGDGDKPTPGRSEALREARSAPVPDFRVGAEAEPGDEPGEAPGEPAGPSPEAEPEAPTETAEGTSPEAEEPEEPEAFLSEVDTTEWGDDERRAFVQYKGDPREVIRALLETKRHSNEQAEQLKGLSGRARTTEEPSADGGPPPVSGAVGQPGEPTSGKPLALPETPEVQSLKLELKARYDANQAAKAKAQELEGEKKNRDSELLKVQGKVEYLEEMLSKPDVPEYERDAMTSRLEALRRQMAGLSLDQTRADVELTRLDMLRSRLADEYDLYDNRLQGIVERTQTELQSRKERETRLKTLAEEEYQSIQQALDTTVRDLQIPKDREKRFRERLLRDADSHDGTISNYKTFFQQTARDILDLGRPAGQTTTSYAEAKRAEARQPAPRGERATAPVPRDERPMSRKEARKRIFEDSRRIPIQGS